MRKKPNVDWYKASSLLSKYKGDADDYFKLWPKDKKFFISDDGKSFLAYKVKYKIVVCMGDPVGPSKSVDMLLAEFKLFCKGRHWRIIFIQTLDTYHEQYISN